MEVELIEIRDFLAAHPPFDCLPPEELEQLPRQLSVRYLRRGTPFPPTDSTQKFLYIVRKGAVEVRDAKDALFGKYAEGDIYSAECIVHGLEGTLKGVTVEDSLFYQLGCQQLQALQQRQSEFNDHFTQSLRERLRHAMERMQGSGNNSLVTLEVAQLLSRKPVCVEPDTTLQQAARLMTEERVSALLITEDNTLVGIITDRDLRTRVIAAGLSHDRPVSEVMTRKLVKVAEDTPGFEALMLMSRLNVHHLPVVGRKGVLGIVTNNDLTRHQSSNTVYLARNIRKCDSVECLREVSRQLPEMQLQLSSAGATPAQIGQAITSVSDALTVRLLELAENAFGSPPVPYVWTCVGSQARREQTVHSDQDNALIIADSYSTAQHHGYFEQLANFDSRRPDRWRMSSSGGKPLMW